MNKITPEKLVWNLDNTHPELAEALRTELRAVMDPEIGLSVIELGLVRQVTLFDLSAELFMIMTTPFCPYAPALLDMTRSKAEKILGQPTTIDLGMEPWDPSMMEEGAAAAWGFF
ncbi:MAG: iron-sulfur cluster assembly protein [Anaerolineales bacterium]|jgi:metal-sulfur cluster biosynthetic enzyme|nr:iron-sulfur cluster assembly protein [Anaerolineales bacterium]